MSKRVLLIDDVRFYRVEKIARNYKDGIKALQEDGPWDVLLLDHDLADFELLSAEEFYKTGVNHKEWTGYDIVCWLEQNPQYLPKKITLVTSNPVGRLRMQALIDKMYV